MNLTILVELCLDDRSKKLSIYEVGVEGVINLIMYHPHLIQTKFGNNWSFSLQKFRNHVDVHEKINISLSCMNIL